jgi:hypothetical protein
MIHFINIFSPVFVFRRSYLPRYLQVGQEVRFYLGPSALVLRFAQCTQAVLQRSPRSVPSQLYDLLAIKLTFDLSRDYAM